jgi:hypothetical protein
MAAMGKERELRRHWQHVRQLILEKADASVVQLADPARGLEGHQA